MGLEGQQGQSTNWLWASQRGLQSLQGDLLLQRPAALPAATPGLAPALAPRRCTGVRGGCSHGGARGDGGGNE